MNKKNIYITAFLGTIIFPVVSFAALDGIKGLIGDVGAIVKLLIPIVFGLALLFFFWGLAQFILNAGDEKTREDGKQRMLWGIVAMFVLASIWGIIGFLAGMLGIPANTCVGGYNTTTGASC